MALTAPRFLFVRIRQFFSLTRSSPRAVFSRHRYRKNLQDHFIERCCLGSLLRNVLEGDSYPSLPVCGFISTLVAPGLMRSIASSPSFLFKKKPKKEKK